MTKSLIPLTSSVAQRENRNLKCPHCDLNLIVIYQEEIEVDTCPSCNGCWADPSKESLLLRKRPAGLSIDELHRLRKLYRPLGKLDKVKYIPCPVCNEMMVRKNWGSYSGIIVDICSEHGTWFDDRELDKIKEYVFLGGIEYQKVMKPQVDLDNTKGKLYKEVERLEDKTLRVRIMNFLFGI